MISVNQTLTLLAGDDWPLGSDRAPQLHHVGAGSPVPGPSSGLFGEAAAASGARQGDAMVAEIPSGDRWPN